MNYTIKIITDGMCDKEARSRIEHAKWFSREKHPLHDSQHAKKKRIKLEHAVATGKGLTTDAEHDTGGVLLKPPQRVMTSHKVMTTSTKTSLIFFCNFQKLIAKSILNND